ncbi:uncharacterized protein LOC105785620 [Gossypium raimondii]|uniref:uncharacterized protein LOC105785620 n=1 Tax=Gossypium raimondii TaxID=29730 RepID=UPI002279FFC7|nr:uncharacterized protein LOC105785620 [Gossypium raimondii]
MRCQWDTSNKVNNWGRSPRSQASSHTKSIAHYQPANHSPSAADPWRPKCFATQRKVVPEAIKFRTSDIDPEFEGKLDQMFMAIVATGDKAWAPSSGTLRSDFFEDVNNEIPEESEEENMRNDVHISNDVQIDGNGQKRKNPEMSSSHFKTGRKKSSKQIRVAARLSSQIEKLCNATDNMSQAKSSLTSVMDPYGIPQAVKMLDSMSEEVPEASSLYFFALRLLLNKDKRIMFLSINPKIRALWLKTEMKDS